MFVSNHEDNSYLEKSEKTRCANDYVKWGADGVLLRLFLLITCIKLLLIPTYYSTDFEVHRNWLAITYSLPIEEWYINAISPWTLDYPPLFAWFEYCLSPVADLFDSEMLKVENLNYASPSTIYFQRFTVMFADIMFAYGVREIGIIFYKSYNTWLRFTFLSLINVGLLLVDHVHFQYNGFLLGILLLSIARIVHVQKQISVLKGATWFCILLNMKHIYLYIVPAYIVWLLRCYCMKDGMFMKRIFTLGIIVFISLLITFGPFITQLPQIMSRLFPFKRGLVHAYWAANSWALYISADKILSIIWKQLGWLKGGKAAVMTGGLVQEQSFTILPTPTPLVTFIITFLSMWPALWSLFVKKGSIIDKKYFIRCIVICALSAFMFGWHVHEKAILTAIIPLCVNAVVDMNDARIFIILSSAGHTALLPLLYPSNLTPLKMLSSLLYMILTTVILTRQFKHLLYIHEWVYISILPLFTLYETVLHKFIFGDKLPFLPLAVTSIYCAVGISYSWLLYYYMILYKCDNVCDKDDVKDKKKQGKVSMYKKRKVL